MTLSVINFIGVFGLLFTCLILFFRLRTEMKNNARRSQEDSRRWQETLDKNQREWRNMFESDANEWRQAFDKLLDHQDKILESLVKMNRNNKNLNRSGENE